MTPTPIVVTDGAYQGDLMIEKAELPSGVSVTQEHPNGCVVAHSETGHHHTVFARIVEGQQASTVCYLNAEGFGDPTGMTSWLEIGPGAGADLVHQRPFDTHAPMHLPPGSYKMTRQREHTPEGWRRVED